jgi:hypothetical protein
MRKLTGPSRSGIMTTSRPTLKMMHMNPRRVTMFGASHSGSSSTKAFHYHLSAVSSKAKHQALLFLHGASFWRFVPAGAGQSVRMASGCSGRWATCRRLSICTT